MPISSSGHLFLAEHWLNQTPISLSFVLLLHLATFFSIFTLFFKDIRHLLLDGVKKDFSFFIKFFIALFPSFFIGLFFRSWVEEQFQKNTVAFGFLISGLLLASLFFLNQKQKSMKEMSWLNAFFIGAMQALAVLPGFSRSALTITAGLYCGLSPRASVLFSFLISLPVILGSSLIDFSSSSFNWNQDLFLELSLSFMIAFITGLLSLILVLRLVQSHKLQFFSFYLIPLGLFLFL